ncbi:MAG TPA: tetratricopeptide repeat protein [Pyrinomonadaceae bacterium]
MNIPAALKRSLLSRTVIPFVGAGVSMAVKEKAGELPVFPGWRQLLERAADRLRNEHKPKYANAVQSLVELNKTEEYLTAAKLARVQLGPVWFTFLKEQLNPPRELIDDNSLRLARSIWGLGSRLVITTNYDRVLHWACPQPDDLSSWDIEAPAEQIQTLRHQLEHPTVWHLHGQINNAANLILCPDGYSLLYPETNGIEVKYKAALTTLRTLLSTHSFLFIGFSLDDFHFVKQLNDVHKMFRGATGPHYVLVREADADRIAGSMPVEVLTFKEFDQPLIDLLQEMGELAHQPQSSNIAPPPPETNASLAPSKSYSPENPVFFVPYLSKGERFLGRQPSLEALRAQLTKGSPTDIGKAAVLIGLGGLGKSQLAVEYAYLYRDDYPNGVIWLNADQDIDSQLIALAEEACWVAPEADQKIKLEVARHRLRTYSKTLIILDNLDSLDAIESYLPSSTTHPCILATSRIDQPHFVPVPLYPLDDDVSLKLLVQEGGAEPVGDAEWEAARDIAETCGGLPLALEMAGAYLRHRPVGWQKYLHLLRTNLTAAMPDRLFTSVTKYEADLYSTLRISEETVASEPLLRNILDLLTWSGSSPMSDNLLCALLDIEDDVGITSAIGLGTAMRILQRSPDGGHTVHRLVREIRQKHTPLSDQLPWVDMICERLADWFDNELDRVGMIVHRHGDTEHLRAWITHAGAYAPRHATRLKLLTAIAIKQNAQYVEALSLIEDAHSSLALKSNEPALEGRILGNRASIAADLGHYEDALEDYKKALTIWTESFGGHHKYMSPTLFGIASCYFNLSKHSLSLRFAKESLEIDPLPVSQDAELGLISSNYLALRDFKPALEYAQKALALSKASFGEHHIKTAHAINNLGNVYNGLGDYKNALEQHSKAQEIIQRLYPHHPDTAMSFHNIGIIYLHAGQHENAQVYLEKAFAMQKEFFDDKHPAVVRTVANLAAVLTASGKRREAHDLLSQYFRDLPKNHPFYLTLKSQIRQLLANPLQAGFRQPSSKKGKRRKKSK